MTRTFRANKMIDRVNREGNGHLLDEETLAFIRMLDGKTGSDYNWKSQVCGEPMVFIPPDNDQAGTYVNAADCD